MRKQFTSLVALLAMALGLSAQVTSSSIYGIVTDDSGAGIPGATVTATHVPSGTYYGVITRDDGGYALPNVRVGGPYRVEASFTGYQTNTQDDIVLKLGEKRRLDIVMREGVELQAVEVVGDRSALINADRTGASSNVTLEQLRTMPTITRSTADLTRLNPMAAEGGSFAGRNDQFNNYSLDGSIFNNPFGLDAATPGGQADAQPVSLDAIEQITVNIAPFDVTQSGFTGASVDAVTKSGTNELKGSVFAYYRNKDMIGVKVDDTEVTRGDLSQLQTGFSIGGPIIKNKVFFFANMEIERRSDLGSYFNANRGTGAANESRVLASDMEFISNLLRTEHNYETGAYENFKHKTHNQKGIFKLDFNLSAQHKLTTTFNFLDAFRDKPAHPSAIGRRGPDVRTLQFQNSGYRINNKLFSGIAELKSIFGNKFANKLQVARTAFRDSRDAMSEPFPVLNFGKDGIRYIVAGHEPFSINNRLDQDVLQLTDNFNIYLNNHTLTVGTSFEKFQFDNSFNLTGYGARVFFPDIDISEAEAVLTSPDFATEVADARAAFDNNNKNDSWALAETNLGQWAFYAQDEWSVNEDLTVTLGLRADMPLYFDTEDKIQENIDRNCCYDPSIVYYDEDGNSTTFDHTVLPEQKPLFSPRLGLNYNFSDGAAQLRGGTGLFTGRFPFVWIGNQTANPNFFFYCVTDPNFKYPQVWRSNIGYDRDLGHGWKVTMDAIYTKDINAAMVRNYGLRLPTGQLEGVGSRPIYRFEDRATVFGGPTNAYVFTNTDAGQIFNAAIQIEKNFFWGTRATLAYNYLNAEDAASIDAEISSDAYDRNPANVEHTNRAELAPSLYGNKHRVVGSIYHKLTYGKNMATYFASFFEFVQGGRYSYTYSGDINNDGSGLNDLIYIPTDSEVDQMNFGGDVAGQRAALKAYIAQDDYLSENRGQFAEKYGSVSPWYGRWDIRIMQEIGLNNKQNVQISLDILNFGNLLSSKWGVRQSATQTGLVQPIGVSVDAATSTPTYAFDSSLKQTFFNDFSLASRWQAQLGLRFNF